MTPAQAVAMLDKQLRAHGETVTARRLPAADIPSRGFVRGYKPADLVGDIKQGDLRVTLSPTGLAAILPFKAGDKVLVAGAVKNVEQAEHVRMLDQIVRINLRVRG